MFDKLKFSSLIAFHIAFKISIREKGMSSLGLSEEYELRQKTCWAFKWKTQQAMASSKRYPLEGEVRVDEFFVGGEEEQKRGCERGKKRLVAVALEVIPGKGVGRAYAQVVSNASAASIRPLFDDQYAKMQRW